MSRMIAPAVAATPSVAVSATHARGSFTAEVRFLRSWLSRRMAWMDRVTRP